MVTRYQRNLRVALKQYKGNMAIAHQVLEARGVIPKYETRYAKKFREKAEVYQGETETAPSDPTDWEGETEYEPYA